MTEIGKSRLNIITMKKKMDPGKEMPYICQEKYTELN